MNNQLSIADLIRLRDTLAEEAPGDNVYILGGAVRDAYTGVSIKDIDVLVERDSPEDFDFDSAGRADGHQGYDYSAQRKIVVNMGAAAFGPDQLGYDVTSENTYTDGDDRMYATYDVPSGDERPKLNVIFAESFDKFFGGFPDNISQAYISELGLETTALFDEGHRQKVLTSRDVQDDERNQRLLAKYPDYTFNQDESIGE